jgi:Ion channel
MRSRQRYGMLLGALGATFFFEGVAQPGDVQRLIATVLVGVSLFLALYAAEIQRKTVGIGAIVVIAALVVGALITSAVGNGSTAEGVVAIANGLLVALGPPVVVLGLVRDLRAKGAVTITVVFGVLCLYLLVGLLFASIYVAIQNLGGDPFFANGAPATSTRAVYFSFVTVTTVGYGDYTARSNLGHTLAVTEALIGQIYLVTVVAAIVGRAVPRSSAAALSDD